jgi:hypothetical protein
MKRDPYLDKYVRLLEATANRAHKDLERERKRLDFLEGKVERLDLVVMGYKNDAGREYVDRSDRAAAPPAPKKPAVTQVSVNPNPKFSDIKEKWNSMTAEEQEKAIAESNMLV